MKRVVLMTVWIASLGSLQAAEVPVAGRGTKGGYESLRHGMYNHHHQFLVNGSRVVVYWTNHLQDENGSGQRLLAKVTEGVSKTAFGGPQYFKALNLGDSIWIIYSIGKEDIGITQIPFAVLAPIASTR